MTNGRAGRIGVVAGVLLALSVWTHARPRPDDVPHVDAASAIPLAFGDWIGRDAPPLDPDVAATLAADRYVHRYYGLRRSGPEARVEMDLAYYARPQAGAAMHSPLNCLPGNGWQVIASAAVPAILGGQTGAARRLVVARGGDRVAMTYWFQNRGALVGNEYRQRLQLLVNGLQGRPTDAALVRVMALDTPDGHRSLTRFSAALAALLDATFR